MLFPIKENIIGMLCFCASYCGINIRLWSRWLHYLLFVQISLELQLFTVQLLKNLLRRERNQQIMCSIGLPHELLCHFSGILEDDAHTLHGPLQRIFERLATQALTPRDLR